MGIGKAIAKRAVAEGAKVVIHGLEQELALELQNKLGKKNSVIHIEDLSIKGCTDRLVSLAIKTWNKIDAIVINAAAYTHTSIGIGDAIKSIKTPVIEVHISNTFSREDFRHKSYITPNSRGLILGFGLDSYRLAIESFLT